MSGMRATSPMKADLARQIRTTAGKVDESHPEMSAAGQHLRKAATLVQSGMHDGAKRHLDAAMELMTPRNLIRHGITDDEGHAQAKMAMHQTNVHRLGVMDIQDTEARNEQQASAKRDSIAQQAQARAAKLQAAAAAKQQTATAQAAAKQAAAEQRTAAKPTGTGPGSQQQTGPQPDPILATAVPTCGGLLLAYNPAEPRGRGGRWAHTGQSTFTYPGPAGSFEHARAVDRYADSTADLPADSKTLIKQANRAMMSRDIPTALSRLAGARWHDANFGQGLHLADIDSIGASFRKVPSAAGVRNGPRNPLMRGQQHPGVYRERRGAVVGAANDTRAVELSARTAVLEVTPHPNGRPGGPGLYGKAGNKHSDYFEQIVHALMTKRGMSQAQASAIAWSRLRKWSAGGGKVHPEVRAAAAKALGQEQAAKLSWDTVDRLIELACPIGLAGYNPAEQRVPAGQAGGGQFGGGQGQPGGKGTRAQRRAKLVKQAVNLRGEITALLAAIHGATHHGKSKSSTPRKKGAAATSAKQAAQSKAAAAKHPAKAGTKAAAKAQTLTQMKARLSELRAQLHTVTAEIHQLANEDRAAIELARGNDAWRNAWRHELRGPGGQFASGAGGPRTPAAQARVRRNAAKAAMVRRGSQPRSTAHAHSLRAATGAPASAQAAGGVAVADSPLHPAVEHRVREIAKQLDTGVQQAASKDAAAKAAAAAKQARQALTDFQEKSDADEKKAARLKFATEAGVAVAGAVVTWVETKMGAPDMALILSAPAVLFVQLIIEWIKRL